MVPRRGIELPNLSGVQVFIAAGKNDPICPAAGIGRTGLSFLQVQVRETEVHWEMNGHTLTRTEVDAAAEWYKKNSDK